MNPSISLDAIVVGSGPNGLAAAITLARAGRSVRVLEAADTPGGGSRTTELTIPGYLHDVCAAIHPLAAASPFFRDVDLEAHGLTLVQPEIPLAHPLDGGRAAVLERSLEETCRRLGSDGRAWRWLVGRPANRFARVAPDVLGPALRRPRDPIGLASLGLRGAPSALLATKLFTSDEAKALFSGSAGHAFLPLRRPGTSAFGVLLSAAGHAAGWPVARGGSGQLVAAMVELLQSLGGTIECGRRVKSMSDLPGARAILFDVNPGQLVAIAGPELPSRYRNALARYRHGPGAFKLDYALSEQIPWTNIDCRRAGTVHVGGIVGEIAAAEAAVWRGQHPERPFVLVGQQSIADPTRTPGSGHTLWAYTHVPHGSQRDMSGAVERQIERFAPGFRDTIVARHVAGPSWYAAYNPNNVGGDITGGSHDGLQLVRRPTLLHPHRTANPRLFLCSASTPPGGGVPGMCGYHAARAALRGVLA